MTFNFFKKYPLGFRGLCVTQTCYNFSFYGLKSIFILYVITQLSVSKSDAISLFATLLTVAYGTSLMGGWIADNHLGKKPTIILGGLFQALGIFLLMFPVEEIDFFALALIISIASVFDISEKIDDFLEKEAPRKAIVFD